MLSPSPFSLSHTRARTTHTLTHTQTHQHIRDSIKLTFDRCPKEKEEIHTRDKTAANQGASLHDGRKNMINFTLDSSELSNDGENRTLYAAHDRRKQDVPTHIDWTHVSDSMYAHN